MLDPTAGGGDTEVAVMTDGLSNKQRVFVEAYLQTWNATEAARRAGYKHPDVQGPRLLGNVGIAAAIERRMREMAMQTDEMLARLAEQARANAGDFVVFRDVPLWQVLGMKPPEKADEDPDDADDADDAPPVEVPMVKVMELDPEVIKARGHLIKKIQMTKYGPAIELHDGQAALVHIGKHLKLFTEQVDVTSGGEPIKSSDGYNRAMSSLADALREIVSDSGSGKPGAVDASEQTAVDGPTESGG
jgi:phage terminase small subunit